MTLNQLIKRLQELADKGYGRWKIAVDKSSLWDGNGSFEICNIDRASPERINMCDADGCLETWKNGAEKMQKTIILRGP